MRRALTLLMGSVLLSVSAQAAPTPERKLERAIEGRVAGEPVDCISLRNVSSSQVIPGVGIVYDSGRTVYVNRPRSGAESLSNWDMLVTRTHSNHLCSTDVVELRSRSTPQMMTGLVFLGDFVPYRKVQSATRN
ncbi:MAG TPA: hypothetical protein VGD10_11195 [Allosphingosinicella sp.]|uniref:hypothetical protein n=1 Tax=Allosphingosinicella sp. TaxID=2823234 RepID=UPI002EDB7625